MAQREQVKLTDQQPRSPTPFETLTGLISPFIVLFFVFWYGLPSAILQQLSTLSPSKMLSIWAWRDAIWGHGSPVVLRESDKGMHDAKKEFVSQAYGTVLEVGAGSGETIKYYDQAKIDKLFALEPFPPLVKHLRRTISARGPAFEQKTVLVPLGIQEKTLLRSEYGIAKESIDTLVLVQCLCSMPRPKKHLRFCVELLKPGGTLIMIEHINSLHPTTRLVQDLITPAWSFATNGCELNRDNLASLEALSCWEDMVVKRPTNQTTADLIPHVFVRAIKKGR